MTKTGKRIVAGILAFFMLGGVVLSAGLFKQKDDNSGASTGFDYSKGLDRDGFFEKIKASDYVTLPDYASYTIPYETAHSLRGLRLRRGGLRRLHERFSFGRHLRRDHLHRRLP